MRVNGSRRIAALALLALAKGLASASPAAAEPVGAEAWPHSVAVGVGFWVPLFQDTPLGDALVHYGLDLADIGPAFSLSYEERVLPWLSLGGTVQLRYTLGAASAGTAGIFRGALHGPEAGLFLVTPRVFARASFYDSDRAGDGGLEMGVELSVGGGATMLSWRGEVDAAAHLELAGALVWAAHLSCWETALRVVHSGLWQEGLGPLDVGTSGAAPVWIPTVELRLGKRW